MLWKSVSPLYTTGGTRHLQLWPRNQKQSRDLEYYVCGKVANVQIVEFIAIQLEVFFQAADVGVADIGLV